MNDGSGAAAGLMGAGIVVILVAILIPLGIYIWTALALGAVFTKAGEPVWKAWVPVVNTWTLYELGGKPGFWALLAFLPIVNIVAFVFLIISIDTVNKRFGRGSGLTVLAVFLFPIWASILGWGSSRLLSGPLRPAYPTGQMPSDTPAAPPAPPTSPFSLAGGAAVTAAPPPPPAPPAPPAPPRGPALAPPPPPPPSPSSPFDARPATPWPAPPAPAPAAPAAAPTAFIPPPPPSAPKPAEQPSSLWAPAPATAPDVAPAAPAPAAPTPVHIDEDDERTVISRSKRPSWLLTLPDGSDEAITASTVILGRSPSAPAGSDAQVIAVVDDTKTVSKSHAVLRLVGDTWVIEDSGSTNGSIVLDESGAEIEVTATHALIETFQLGDATFRIRKS